MTISDKYYEYLSENSSDLGHFVFSSWNFETFRPYYCTVLILMHDGVLNWSPICRICGAEVGVMSARSTYLIVLSLPDGFIHFWGWLWAYLSRLDQISKLRLISSSMSSVHGVWVKNSTFLTWYFQLVIVSKSDFSGLVCLGSYQEPGLKSSPAL